MSISVGVEGKSLLRSGDKWALWEESGAIRGVLGEAGIDGRSNPAATTIKSGSMSSISSSVSVSVSDPVSPQLEELETEWAGVEGSKVSVADPGSVAEITIEDTLGFENAERSSGEGRCCVVALDLVGDGGAEPEAELDVGVGGTGWIDAVLPSVLPANFAMKLASLCRLPGAAEELSTSDLRRSDRDGELGIVEREVEEALIVLLRLPTFANRDFLFGFVSEVGDFIADPSARADEEPEWGIGNSWLLALGVGGGALGGLGNPQPKLDELSVKALCTGDRKSTTDDAGDHFDCSRLASSSASPPKAEASEETSRSGPLVEISSNLRSTSLESRASMYTALRRVVEPALERTRDSPIWTVEESARDRIEVEAVGVFIKEGCEGEELSEGGGNAVGNGNDLCWSSVCPLPEKGDEVVSRLPALA
jgi:hypothetical protein